MASGRQSDIGADTSRSLEACRIIDRRLKTERSDRTDTRRSHEPADLHIMTRQLVNLMVEIANLLLDGLARLKQRPDRSDQLGTVLDQLLGSHSKDIELGAARSARYPSARPISPRKIVSAVRHRHLTDRGLD